MYAGHFAAALALKTARPEAPTWALVAGVGALDLLFGVAVAAGIEGFAPDFAVSHRLMIPWSHALATSLLVGAGFAACFWRRNPAVAVAIFAAVQSHWLLDVLVHRPDMTFWPGSANGIGYFSLFGSISGWAETIFVIGCTGLYAASARRAPDYGRHWPVICGLMAMFWLMGRSAA